jgi:hypothetical protein
MDKYVLLGLLQRFLREPSSLTIDAQGNSIAVFTPPLTTAEQATFADLQTMAKFGVSITLAEWQSVKTDAANLKTYLGVASPTLVQTAAATKSIIRILATIVRS